MEAAKSKSGHPAKRHWDLSGRPGKSGQSFPAKRCQQSSAPLGLSFKGLRIKATLSRLGDELLLVPLQGKPSLGYCESPRSSFLLGELQTIEVYLTLGSRGWEIQDQVAASASDKDLLDVP